MNNDDFFSGFLFGLVVAESVHGIPRRNAEATWPKLKAVLQGIVNDDITLVDSPEEAERELGPPLPPEVKAAFGFDPNAYLRDLFRKGREEHKTFAALALAALNERGA